MFRRGWRAVRRPRLLQLWTAILGKLHANEQDGKWFVDIRQAVILETADRGTYTRIALDLPIATDFAQHPILLLLKGLGPFPALICWTSTTLGLHRAGRVVGQMAGRAWLCGADELVFLATATAMTQVMGRARPKKLCARFGHWLPMAKMVHDAQRQAEHLRSW